MAEYIALSTQSVGVGPGRCHAPDLPLLPEPNLPSLVARFETSRLYLHACVSLRAALPFVSIQFSHHFAAISHRRVAIVDYQGGTLLDRFVKPTLPVSDYRTSVTGILPQHLESGKRRIFIFLDGTPLTPCVLQLSVGDALTFDQAQQHVASIIADKIIVGHSLWNDFSGALLLLSPLFSLTVYPVFSSSPHCADPRLVLGLPHRAVATRDFALYRPFRKTLRTNNIVGLPTLMWHFMKREVQKEHVVPVSSCIPSSKLSRLSSVGTDPFYSIVGKRSRCHRPLPIRGERLRRFGRGWRLAIPPSS